MSRSYRKTPICGITTCSSEKNDKRVFNRILRRTARHRMKKWHRYSFFRNKKEVMDIWIMGKDGKHMFDPNKYPNLMRK